MADYGTQQGRNYRPNTYGQAPSLQQRDAAFSEIFGGNPPPGRSQTMNSQTPQFSQDRAHTMTSHVPESYMHPRGSPAPNRPPPPPGYGQRPPPPAGYPNSQWRPNGPMAHHHHQQQQQ